MSGENEDHVRKQLLDAFGHDDIYGILNVTRESSAAEIKKSYMKLALTHHPDKGGEVGKFQALSMAHAILSDPEKKKLYDSNGFMSAGDDLNDESFEFWYQYFRNLFPEITTADIESFGKTYIGSEEEKNDIIDAYQKHKGNLKHIMDSIMFAEAGEEARIIDTIDSMITDGRLKSTKKYNDSKAGALTTADSSKGKKKRKKAQEEDNSALILAMQQKNQARRKQATTNILSYLSPEERMQMQTDDIPDDEFERIQAEMKMPPASKSKSKGRK